jgi:hypothetical protein
MYFQRMNFMAHELNFTKILEKDNEARRFLARFPLLQDISSLGSDFEWRGHCRDPEL